MTICKGVVKGNVVILEDVLPEGSEVEVRVIESKSNSAQKKLAIDAIMAFGRKLEGRGINLSKCLAEAREELENRV